MDWQLIKNIKQHKALLDIGCIFLFVILANVLLITGIVNGNPLDSRSDLLSSARAGVTTGQPTIDPNDGFTKQALGEGAYKQITSGHMPWWNYYEGVGAPLAGEMQSAAFFPIVFLSASPILFRIVLQLIAGIGTYLLLKRFGCSRKVCIVGATAFSLNGTFAWLNNAVVNPVAFLPWLILGVEQSLSATKNNKRAGFFLFAISAALSIYAGFPETAFINFLFVAIWTLVRFFQLENKKLRLSYLRKTVSGAILGVLLAAPILDAFLTYLPYANIGVHGSVGGGLTKIGLPALFFPYIYGPIFGYSNIDPSGSLSSFWGSVGGFMTLLVVFMAVMAYLDKKHRALIILMWAWIAVAVAKIFNLPVISKLIGLIPGLSHTAFYRYSPPSIEFAAIITMALGLDFLFKHKSVSIKFKTFRPALIITSLLTILSLIIARIEIERLKVGHAKYWVVFSLVWGIGVICFVVIWFNKIRFKTAYIISGLIIFESLLFFAVPQLSSLREPKIDLGPVKFLQSHMKQGQRFYTLGPIQPDYGSYWQIASINTNDLPVPQSWTNYIGDSLDNNVNATIFDGLNGLSPNGVSPINAFIGNIKAYQYVGVKYVVTPVSSTDSQQLTAAGLRPVYSDKTASIFELPKTASYYSLTNGSCITSYLSLASVKINCSSDGQILRRELYMPGWSATDQTGKQLKIHKQGPLFQSVNVNSSTKQVNFSFSPPHIQIAYILFILGLIYILGYWLKISLAK